MEDDMSFLTLDQHLERHVELHKMLDELVTDYINNTNNNLSNSSIMDLIQWSYSQTKPETISSKDEDYAIYR